MQYLADENLRFFTKSCMFHHISAQARTLYSSLVQKKKAAAMIVIQLLVFCLAGLVPSVSRPATLLVIGIEALITLMAITLAKRSLGGMSGDIAGFGIVFGELAGIFAMLVF